MTKKNHHLLILSTSVIQPNSLSLAPGLAQKFTILRKKNVERMQENRNNISIFSNISLKKNKIKTTTTQHSFFFLNNKWVGSPHKGSTLPLWIALVRLRLWIGDCPSFTPWGREMSAKQGATADVKLKMWDSCPTGSAVRLCLQCGCSFVSVFYTFLLIKKKNLNLRYWCESILL